MLKKLLRLMTVTVLVALIVLPAQAKVNLTMVTHWNTSVTHGALLKQYVEEFNRIQDEIEVTLESYAGQSHAEKVAVWTATNTMPDILPVSQADIPQWVDAGIISPMPDDIVGQLQDIFLPGAFQLTAYDGEIWGYPTENMPNAFTYDLVDFNNKGIGGQFPETWSDLLAVAKRLTEYDANGAITRAGFGWNLDFRRNIGILMALTWAEGGELFTDGGQSFDFLSDPVMRSINFLDDLINEQNIVRFGGNHSHSVQAIRWAPGPYVRGTMLAESGPERFAEFRSARLPIGPNGQRTVANYGWVVTVPTATTQKDEVHRFLMWLFNDLTERGTTRMGDIMAMLGSIPNTMPDVVNQPVAQEPFMQGFVAPMMDGQVRSWPMPPAPVFGPINTALTAIFNRDGAPRNTLENLQRQVDQLIAEVVAD